MADSGRGGEPQSFTPTLHPSLPESFTPTLHPSLQETVPEFPCTFLPPTPAPTPPRPPLGPATLAPPRPLVVPKVERLSPPAPSGKEGLQGLEDSRGWREGKEEGGIISGARTRGTGQWDLLSCLGLSVGLSVSATGGERRLSGELNSMPGPGTMSVRVSPPQPILSRGRPDKVALSPHPKISLLPYALPHSFLGSPHFLPPHPRLKTGASHTYLRSRSGASISSWDLTPCMGW